MKRYTMTTQREVRRAFWQNHSDLPNIVHRRFNGDWNTDRLARNGDISEVLAQRVTL